MSLSANVVTADALQVPDNERLDITMFRQKLVMPRRIFAMRSHRKVMFSSRAASASNRKASGTAPPEFCRADTPEKISIPAAR